MLIPFYAFPVVDAIIRSTNKFQEQFYTEMRKIIIVYILMMCIQQTLACDICGCSAGNYFIGPFPQFTKHFIGVRYTSRKFHSIKADDQNEYSRDHYQTTELWGGINIGRRWQALVFLPYNVNRQQTNEEARHEHGMGDISLIANYKLINSRKFTRDGDVITQQVWVGGGAKLPTGRFADDAEDFNPEANNQPGSGSTDFIGNMLHALHVRQWGINTNFNYRHNTKESEFRFGDRISLSSIISYTFERQNLAIIPNAGLVYDHLNENYTGGEKVHDTGGSALHSSFGFEVRVKNFSVGCNAQLPIIQNLSNGQTSSQIRAMAHMSFLF
jgi:hypothetical protein